MHRKGSLTLRAKKIPKDDKIDNVHNSRDQTRYYLHQFADQSICK